MLLLNRLKKTAKSTPTTSKSRRKMEQSSMTQPLVHGVIIDKERVHPGMPKKVEDARIALLNSAIEVKETEVDAEIRITDPAQMQAFIEQEEQMIRDMVNKVADAGATVLFCQKGIDDLAQHYLAKAGVMAVRRVKKSDMEKLSRATGAKVVSNIEDLTFEDLGDSRIRSREKNIRRSNDLRGRMQRPKISNTPHPRFNPPRGR